MNIEQIINENSNYIYNFAMKLTCHPQTAEDLAQQTFISAWKNLDGLREEYAVKKWLRTICYNQFISDCRKNKMNIDLVDDMDKLIEEGEICSSTPLPEETVIVSESIRELQNGCFYAMARKLTLPQRIAFSLVDMFGLSMEETADMLEINVNALKGLLYRARMNLDAFFGDHCNLVDASNPCSCEAWINFSCNHSDNQKKIRESFDNKEYESKGYIFSEKVRYKVNNIYKQIPDRKPDKEWYDKVIKAVTE